MLALHNEITSEILTHIIARLPSLTPITKPFACATSKRDLEVSCQPSCSYRMLQPMPLRHELGVLRVARYLVSLEELDLIMVTTLP